MQVIATAGHVDHGKSTLLRALTGMEPDRWVEERQRGMTIDLGYVWMRLPSGIEVSIVDVPGHERFTTNMLAGIGPAPAVLLVVAADEGWSAQTEEHVRAINALGVTNGLLVVTKSDLVDPSTVRSDALQRLSLTSLAGVDTVAVSAFTGEGLDILRVRLDELAAKMPTADSTGRIRLWIDRSFTMLGAGTVVTGTLGSGTVRRGDILELRGERIAVRAVQQSGRPSDSVVGPARVALNLRGVDCARVKRGDVLLTPGGWYRTALADVASGQTGLPNYLTFHVGTAAIPARVRALDDRGDVVRISLGTALPLSVGDRAILRDPGRRHVLCGVHVLDPSPPQLRRRGEARQRAAALRMETGVGDIASELRRRGAVSHEFLSSIGVPIPDSLPAGTVNVAGWLVDASLWRAWQGQLREQMTAQESLTPVGRGVSLAQLIQTLRLPSRALLPVLLTAIPEAVVEGGYVRQRTRERGLSPRVAAAITTLAKRLADEPFSAPQAAELKGFGLGPEELAEAAARKAIVRLPGDVVLLPKAVDDAIACLRSIPQPFTLAAARDALKTSRRVAVPLMEYLDRRGVTIRIDSNLRSLRAGVGRPAVGPTSDRSST